MKRTSVLVATTLVVLGLAWILPTDAVVNLPPVQCTQNAGSGQQTYATNTVIPPSVLIPIKANLCAANGILMIVTIELYGGIPLQFTRVPTDNLSDDYVQGASVGVYHCDSAPTTGLGQALKGCATGHMFTNFLITYYTVLKGTTPGHIGLTVYLGAAPGNAGNPGRIQTTWQFWSGLTNYQVGGTCTASQAYNSADLDAFTTGTSTYGCTVTAPPDGIFYSVVAYALGSSGNTGYTQYGTTYPVNQADAVQWDNQFCSNAGATLNLCSIGGGGNPNGGGVSSQFMGWYCNSNCAASGLSVINISFGGLVIQHTSGGGNSTCNPAPACQNSTNNCAQCGPAGGGTSITSGNYTGHDQWYGYIGQNTQGTGGTIYNFTSKVAQAHCTKATCYVLMGIYIASLPTNPPSSSNPLILASPTFTFPITNGTKNFGISTQLSIGIQPNWWWAVAILSNSTASRTAGASGSGVSVYAANWDQQMQTTIATSASGGLMPSCVGSGTSSCPALSLYTSFPLYFWAAANYSIASSVSVTTTSTSLATSTVTATTTVSNVINQPAPAAASLLAPELIILIPFAAFSAAAVMLREVAKQK